MRIGIDTRLQNETGVGRYIRNLTHYLPLFDKKNDYVFINPSVPWHSLQEQLEMPRIIKENNVDLMHFPYFNVPLMYSGRFIVTIHDLIINQFDTGRASTRNQFVYKMKRLGYGFITNHAVHKACTVIVPSNATKDVLLKHYPDMKEERVVVTYEGVDHVRQDSKIQRFKDSNEVSSEAMEQLNNEKPFFLYVGNAYPHKNLEFLITSFAKLENSEWKLVLVGEMNYFYYRILELVKSLQLSDRVILTGSISDSELSWLYQNARATVLPSLMEGFGLPALEAMKHGCPVLASNIPAFQEMCEDAVVYFDPHDQNNLTQLLQSVVEGKIHDQFKQNIKKGKIRAEKFSWKKMAKETIHIYERCLGL